MDKAGKKLPVAVLVAFAAVYIFWGSTYLAIRIGVHDLPAFFMAGTRFMVAGPVMLVYCKFRGLKVLGDWRSMLWTVLIGVLLLTAGNVGWLWRKVCGQWFGLAIAGDYSGLLCLD